MSSAAPSMSVDVTVPNLGNSDVMTPIEKLQTFRRHNENCDINHDDDDDDVLDESVEGTNHKSYNLLTNCNEESLPIVDRDQLCPNDVILGRGSNEKGQFAAVLKDWWKRYEDASHSNKREITRAALQDMYNRGVRFLNRIDNGTRNGYYTVEPQASARVERKVLRSLRQEFLNTIIQNQKFESTESRPVVAGPAKALPVGTDSKVQKVPRVHSVKTKTKIKKESSISKIKKTKKKRAAVVKYIATGGLKYIPILPSSLRPQENIKIVLPPPIVPPFSPHVLIPPAMRMTSSLDSVTGTKTESTFSLIPSAINFGTSDLAGAATSTDNGTLLQPPIVATSPDTVLASDYFSYLASSFDVRGMINQGNNSTNIPTESHPPFRSSASFDFTRIFDDTVVDNAMNDVEAKISPPILTGRQSSIFSAVSFKEWSQNQKDIVPAPVRQSILNPRSKYDGTVPATANLPIHIAGQSGDDGDYIFPKIKTTENINRDTIFEEGLIPISPTPMYYNITNEVEHFVQGKMSYVTPSDLRYDPTYRTATTPTRSNTKRNISDEFERDNTDEYQALCNKLEDSMAKLEREESQHKNWEAHNEGLWRHFIQEQPDLAKMLLSHSRNSTTSEFHGHPASVVQHPPKPNAYGSGGGGISSTFDSRSTSPVPWKFYHDTTTTSCDNSCSEHQSVSSKWQQLFASDNEESWEEV